MVQIKSLNSMCLCFCPCSLSDSLTDTVCQGNSSNMEKVSHFRCVYPPCHWSCAESPGSGSGHGPGNWQVFSSWVGGGSRRYIVDTLENSTETSSRQGLCFLLIASWCHKGQEEHLTLPVTARSLGEGDINILSSWHHNDWGWALGMAFTCPPT